MDYRDFVVWSREARVRELEQNLNSLSIFRSSQYKEQDYNSVVRSLKDRITELRIGRREMIKSNWESLKRGADNV